MAKLLVAVTIAVLALGTVITQGTALLQTFPEDDTVYVFKATVNGEFLSMVHYSNIDRIEVAGGTDSPPGPESQFRSTVLQQTTTTPKRKKVAFQVPENEQEYVRRMSSESEHAMIVVSQTGVLDPESKFTYEFDPNGPTAIANSGYVRLIADNGNYLRIGPNNRIEASATTRDASTRFIVWELP